MGITALSVFDGVSCGQLALKQSGIKVDNYLASEIDKYAIKVTQENFPDTIQLGSVTEVTTDVLPSIDLFIGGSPCTNLSLAGDMDGMVSEDDEEILSLEKYLELKSQGVKFKGQSYLFWEYVRLLKELRAVNPEIKFLLENVKMKPKWQNLITECLGVEPIMINSSLVSAQSRKRLYWTNIEGITQPEDRGLLLKDILENFTSYSKDGSYPIEDFIHTKKAVDYMNREVSDGRSHWDFQHHSDTANDKAACITANMYKGVPYNVLIDRNVKQINQSKESHGQQPYMQNRVYDTNGISPALTQVCDRLNVAEELKDLADRDKSFCITASVGRTTEREYFYKRQGGLAFSPTSQENSDLKVEDKSTNVNTIVDGKLKNDRFDINLPDGNYIIRKLTPVECCRLQTIPDDYFYDKETGKNIISNSQIYKCCGNGWTVAAVAHIFSFSNFTRET